MNYSILESFSLEAHGDRHEVELFPVVRDQFPSYEILWRRYIVPLTNRVRSGFSFATNRDHWIRICDDVPSAWITWAMHHYSVFYYFARAVKQLQSEEYVYPEDVFSLLDACGDNVREFFLQTKHLVRRVGGSVPPLPTHKKEMYLEKTPGEKTKEDERGCFVEVQRYRDAILHNPVIGRAVDVNREMLPRREALDRVKRSWREASRLRPEELIDSRDLFARLRSETSEFLEFHWKKIISALDATRSSDAFVKELGLMTFSWPESLKEFGSTAQPVSASGSNKLSVD